MAPGFLLIKRSVFRQSSIDPQIRELPALEFHSVSISFSLIACLLLHSADILYRCLNAAAVFPRVGLFQSKPLTSHLSLLKNAYD